MGKSFAPLELRSTEPAPADSSSYTAAFGCPVTFGQTENAIMFDAEWLNTRPALGNAVTYAAMIRLCDQLLREIELHAGLAGKIRTMVLVHQMKPLSVDSIASGVNMSPRTLRRRLREENVSFRKIIAELRLELAMRYLRDTRLSVEDISPAVGFCEPSSFRRAFRRWTKLTPETYRRHVAQKR
jgi:AraC-like DNA-binding protein